MATKKAHLRLLGGRSGSGKTSQFVKEITDILLERPQGDPLILLVPEQMTFQMEQALLSVPDVHGIIRAQVTSFTRLAWRVLQETGGGARQHIDSTGVQMLLRKILEEQKDKLRIYQKSYAKAGFIEALDNIITELSRYCIPVAELQALASTSNDQLLLDKLHDLHIIEQELAQLLTGQYLTAEDYLQLLQQQLQKTCWACATEVWVDGFYSFTTQELQVLQVLLNNCKKLNISCTIDRQSVQAVQATNQLFVSTKRTWGQLTELARIDSSIVEVDVAKQATVATELALDYITQTQRFQHDALSHLEKNWQKTRQQAYVNCTDAIHLVSAVNRRAEVEAVARNMLSKVRDQAYRYRELVIIVRNIADYQELIETTFSKYQIPLFIDAKSSMLHHPLIELVSAALSVVMDNWRYEDVFRCLKTRLLTTGQEQLIIDKLENIVLARGIKAEQWQKTIRHPEYQEQLEGLRQQIVEPLLNLQQKMKKATNCQQLTNALIELLETLAVADKLSLLEDAAAEAGQLLLARQHRQVLPALQELFAQLHQLTGSKHMQLQMFVDMLESGLASLRFAHVPPALDQVVVASIDQSRLYNVRCSYLIGVNEGVIPRLAGEGEFFSEDERELLQGKGAVMADSISQKLYEEPFVLYRALASASDYLWVSYPIADAEGSSLTASPVFRQLMRIFPENKLQLKQLDPYEDHADQQSDYITSPPAVLSLLASQLQRWRKGYDIEQLWWASYLWFLEKAEPEVRVAAERSFASVFATNQELPLKAMTVRQLYGKKINSGVSRLEKQRKCPFAQFVEYGLKLRERKIYEVQASDIGNIYHEALKEWVGYYTQQLNEQHNITEQALLDQAQKIMQKLLEQHNYKIMQSSGKNKYIGNRITEVIKKTCAGLYYQQQQTSFLPVALELAFDNGEKIPALQLALENDYTLALRGKIDRVDVGEYNSCHYLRVIDYKSSAGKLDLSLLVDGSSLQLATYLEVVLSNTEQLIRQKTAQAAAILYFRMHKPLVEINEAADLAKISEKLLSSYKMEGLVVAEQPLIFAMDQQLERSAKGYSSVLPVYLKTDGSLKDTDYVLAASDFKNLGKFTRQQLVKQATDVIRGKITARPLRTDKVTACDWCQYLPVCQFEVGVLDNSYRNILNVKDITEFRIAIKEGAEPDDK